MTDTPLPPSMNSQTPPPGDPASMVSGPAIFLMVVGGIEVAFALLSLLLNVLGVGLGAVAGGGNGGGMMLRGGMGIVGAILGICIGGIVLFGGMKMKKLQGYGTAMTGAIVAMLPCTLCCLIGLPAGIWATVVLMKPEVKAAFTK